VAFTSEEEEAVEVDCGASEGLLEVDAPFDSDEEPDETPPPVAAEADESAAAGAEGVMEPLGGVLVVCPASEDSAELDVEEEDAAVGDEPALAASPTGTMAFRLSEAELETAASIPKAWVWTEKQSAAATTRKKTRHGWKEPPLALRAPTKAMRTCALL
jgi:hypothetical protein